MDEMCSSLYSLTWPGTSVLWPLMARLHLEGGIHVTRHMDGGLSNGHMGGEDTFEPETWMMACDGIKVTGNMDGGLSIAHVDGEATSGAWH